MKLSAEDALKRGIEAHQAGRIQEADKYYTAILLNKCKSVKLQAYLGL